MKCFSKFVIVGYDGTESADSQSPSNSHSTYDTSIAMFDRVKLHGSFEIQQVVAFFYMRCVARFGIICTI